MIDFGGSGDCRVSAEPFASIAYGSCGNPLHGATFYLGATGNVFGQEITHVLQPIARYGEIENHAVSLSHCQLIDCLKRIVV